MWLNAIYGVENEYAEDPLTVSNKKKLQLNFP